MNSHTSFRCSTWETLFTNKKFFSRMISDTSLQTSLHCLQANGFSPEWVNNLTYESSDYQLVKKNIPYKQMVSLPNGFPYVSSDVLLSNYRSKLLGHNLSSYEMFVGSEFILIFLRTCFSFSILSIGNL